MKLFIVSIFDRVADTYAQPAFVPTTASAIRGLADEMNRPAVDGQRNALRDHPDDFDLFLIGEYDDKTGAIVGSVPRCIAMARDLVK